MVVGSVSQSALPLPKKGKGKRLQMTTEQKWQQLYEDAVLETDGKRIEERIQAAESAIKGRLQEFSLNHGGTPEENQAILDASNGLKVLRSEAAAWGSKRAG